MNAVAASATAEAAESLQRCGDIKTIFKQKMNIVDRTYLNIYDTILAEGTRETNRTGTDTIGLFGLSYKLPVSVAEFPILTLKKIQFKGLVYELLWYLSGESHIRKFEKYSSIWSSWADSRGNLESAYGRYWRYYPVAHINKMRDGEAIVNPYENDYFDQIRSVIDELKVNPRSRRMVVTAWYPPNARVSKLPPCHHSFTLNYQKGKLNLHLLMRSNDFAVGAPFNITSYCLLLILICREVNLEPGEFYHSITDAHVYVDHIEPYKAIDRSLDYKLPALDLSMLGDKSIFDLTYADADSFQLVNYQHGPFIKLPVAV